MEQNNGTRDKAKEEAGRINWPGAARCAVKLSFDVDGETLFTDGPEGKDWAWPRSVAYGRFGPRRGVDRILELLDRKGVRATFFIPAKIALNYPEMFRKVDREGHEIGHHGFDHELFSKYTIEEQRDIIRRSQRVFEDLIGKRAVGYRTPSGDFKGKTPDLLMEEGFLYSSSMRKDDRPYRTVINGAESSLIEIPAKWELDDYPYFSYDFYPAMPIGHDRISGYGSTLENWKMEFDGYYKYGLCYVIMFHPQIIGRPGRIRLLEELINYIQSFDGVWFATGAEIAEWWRKTY